MEVAITGKWLYEDTSDMTLSCDLTGQIRGDQPSKASTPLMTQDKHLQQITDGTPLLNRSDGRQTT